MDGKIRKAVEILDEGGIVIFPTDTAFGIGCRIDNSQAVERLFKIRKRPSSQPALVLADSIEMAQSYWKDIPEDVFQKLIKSYWPGALTIILYCNKVKVPKLVRGGGDKLGIRVPNHQTTLKLIKQVGVPILGPSANFHREKTPYKFDELDPKLIKQVDYVISGDASFKKLPSTVIDCSQRPWRVLRKGAVELDL